MTLEQALILDPGGGDDSRTSLDIRPWGEGMTLEQALISDPGGGDDPRTIPDIRPWGRG